jgi:hypothetical protein
MMGAMRYAMVARTCCALITVGLATAGCSQQVDSVPTPIATHLSEATWTDGPWPFTLAEGVLRCRYSYQVTFTANGVEYALNRHAVESGLFVDSSPILRGRADRFGYVEINGERQPVPLDGPDTSRVIARGLDFCS